MSTLLIEGGRPLSGSVAVEGNKNAALPLLAACLLTSDECVLHNVPRISDVEVMVRLLMDLGAQVEGLGTPTLRLRCPEIVKDEPDGALVDRAGLKGVAIGGARVSPAHGNFIVNDGSATAADIRRLIERCRATVRERFGVNLREEIVYLGDFTYVDFID